MFKKKHQLILFVIFSHHYSSQETLHQDVTFYDSPKTIKNKSTQRTGNSATPRRFHFRAVGVEGSNTPSELMGLIAQCTFIKIRS